MKKYIDFIEKSNLRPNITKALAATISRHLPEEYKFDSLTTVYDEYLKLKPRIAPQNILLIDNLINIEYKKSLDIIYRREIAEKVRNYENRSSSDYK
jgi:hypothetical protein